VQDPRPLHFRNRTPQTPNLQNRADLLGEVSGSLGANLWRKARPWSCPGEPPRVSIAIPQLFCVSDSQKRVGRGVDFQKSREEGGGILRCLGKALGSLGFLGRVTGKKGSGSSRKPHVVPRPRHPKGFHCFPTIPLRHRFPEKDVSRGSTSKNRGRCLG
jgi:hypothetical protein